MSTLTSTTSTSRPTLSTGDVGKSYFETDSNKILVWDGTGWNEWNADLVLTPGFSNNNSVNFDGTDDHMTFTSFDAGSSKTLSMWIKLDSISSAGIYLFGSSFYYGYVTANGQIVYIYDGGASALTLALRTLASSNSFSLSLFKFLSLSKPSTPDRRRTSFSSAVILLR